MENVVLDSPDSVLINKHDYIYYYFASYYIQNDQLNLKHFASKIIFIKIVIA
jgi:hypothetical protein